MKFTSPIFLSLATFITLSAQAETIVVPIDVSDQMYRSTGAPLFVGQSTGRIGQSTGATDPKEFWDFTLPFALPTIPEGEQITSATLTVNLEGWTSFSVNGDLEAFGINRVNASSTVVFGDDFVVASNPGSNPNAVLLDSSLIPYSAISGSTGASNQTSPHTSVNISSYVQGLYDNEGGVPGDFGFLTLAVNNDLVGSTSNNYYVISTANSATSEWQPYLTIETSAIPEPSTMGFFIACLGALLIRRRIKRS